MSKKQIIAWSFPAGGTVVGSAAPVTVTSILLPRRSRLLRIHLSAWIQTFATTSVGDFFYGELSLISALDGNLPIGRPGVLAAWQAGAIQLAAPVGAGQIENVHIERDCEGVEVGENQRLYFHAYGAITLTMNTRGVVYVLV